MNNLKLQADLKVLRKGLEAFERVSERLKEFEGKVLNQRIITSLEKEVDPRSAGYSLSYKKDYPFHNQGCIRYYIIDRSNTENGRTVYSDYTYFEVDFRLENNRIVVNNEKLEAQRKVLKNRIAEIETNLNNPDIREDLENERKVIMELINKYNKDLTSSNMDLRIDIRY